MRPGPMRGPRTDQVCIRVHKQGSYHERLRRIARENGLTIGQMVEHWIDEAKPIKRRTKRKGA